MIVILKIVVNDNKEIVEIVREGLRQKNGYCPCSLIKNEDTKCMCKEFREQKTEGLCHCQLYKKILV